MNDELGVVVCWRKDGTSEVVDPAWADLRQGGQRSRGKVDKKKAALHCAALY